jgi:hypothetical protein
MILKHRAGLCDKYIGIRINPFTAAHARQRTFISRLFQHFFQTVPFNLHNIKKSANKYVRGINRLLALYSVYIYLLLCRKKFTEWSMFTEGCKQVGAKI